jgi:hypothetical protein
MGSIAQGTVPVDTGKRFDSLAAYKLEFFLVFGELAEKVDEMKMDEFGAIDCIGDWIEVKWRLELLADNLERKIIKKAVA